MTPTRIHPEDEPISLQEATLPGMISGLIGACFTAAIAGLFAETQGDFWRPMKGVAATFLGDAVSGRPGFQPGPVMFGLMVHLIWSLVLGIFFVWLGGYLSRGAALGWGLLFSLSVWVIMQFGILPVINPALAATPPLPFAAVHVAFGISLGIYPRFLKTATKEIPAIHRKAA
ncbi:MAG: hypothetical protein HY282_08475 [Nitrospirae bacterium]|nr:hypothetical protein [Candidatus Manganitrophaceae bacterium]